jgi:hypothetical protein
VSAPDRQVLEAHELPARLPTAFGAGALLSAVTIDVVFEVLHRAVDARRGFLRTTSISITFLRDREGRRRRRILGGLQRIGA